MYDKAIEFQLNSLEYALSEENRTTSYMELTINFFLKKAYIEAAKYYQKTLKGLEKSENKQLHKSLLLKTLRY
jgi:hypothetical protein